MNTQKNDNQQELDNLNKPEKQGDIPNDEDAKNSCNQATGEDILSDHIFDSKNYQKLLQKPPIISLNQVNGIEQLMLNLLILFLGVIYLNFDINSIAWKCVLIGCLCLEGLVLSFEIFFQFKEESIEIYNNQFKVPTEVFKLILFFFQIVYVFQNIQNKSFRKNLNFYGIKCFIDPFGPCNGLSQEDCFQRFESNFDEPRQVKYFSIVFLVILFLYVILSSIIIATQYKKNHKST